MNKCAHLPSQFLVNTFAFFLGIDLGKSFPLKTGDGSMLASGKFCTGTRIYLERTSGAHEPLFCRLAATSSFRC